MELHSFITFMAGMLVGMGVGMLMFAVVIAVVDWKSRRDS